MAYAFKVPPEYSMNETHKAHANDKEGGEVKVSGHTAGGGA